MVTQRAARLGVRLLCRTIWRRRIILVRFVLQQQLRALLQDLGQPRDEIIGDAVVAEARDDVRLEGRDQGQIEVFFALLFQERKAICDRTYFSHRGLISEEDRGQ